MLALAKVSLIRVIKK